MPGRRSVQFRPGDVGEYFATFILAQLGQVIPVLRQEDFGHDLFCAITRERDGNLLVEDPFTVQLKTISKPGASSLIQYGGFEGSRKASGPRWKRHEIEWLLFNQWHPFLIGIVDARNWRLDLYVPQGMWHVRWMAGRAFRVNLKYGVPYSVPSRVKFSNPAAKHHGDGMRWTVPLGKPVLRLTAATMNENDFARKAQDVLRDWLRQESRNATNQRKGIPFVETRSNWKANERPGKETLRRYGNPGSGMNIDSLLKEAAPIVASLRYNYALQGDPSSKKLKGIVELLEREGFPTG